MSENFKTDNISSYVETIHDHIREGREGKLVASLCMLTSEERKRIISIKVNDNTALCEAVLNKRKEIVKYLISNCFADVNERGSYKDEKTKYAYCAPPLWCATVSGDVDIARILLSYGAEVNGWSDTESTPVRAACFCNDLPMVKFLVENGANIFKPNIYGGTCLMNSVLCVELVKFLISKGVDVNSIDYNGSTALHYAAQEGQEESTKVLLENGAKYTLINKKNWTPIKLAAVNGHDSVVEVFVNMGVTTSMELQEVYQLLGCHCVDSNIEKTTAFWKKSFQLRSEIPQLEYQPIQYSATAKHIFGYINEIDFMDLLSGGFNDEDRIFTHALLFYIRILGEHHDETIHQIRYRGAVYADKKLYQKCLELWKYAYSLTLEKCQFLDSDTVNAGTSLANIFCEMQIDWEKEKIKDKVQMKDILEVFTMMKSHIDKCSIDLVVRPLNITTINNYKFLLQSVLHIINVFRCLESDGYQYNEFVKILEELIDTNVKTYDDQTLLHLAVDPATSNVDDTYCSNFPSLHVIKILLKCGIDLKAIDNDGRTALLCSIHHEYETKTDEQSQESGES